MRWVNLEIVPSWWRALAHSKGLRVSFSDSGLLRTESLAGLLPMSRSDAHYIATSALDVGLR